MKTVRYILLNPVGIAIVFVHWIVVVFAMFGDKPEPGFNKSTYLTEHLVWFDMPALLLTNLISKPIIYAFGIYAWSNSVYSIVGIASVTLQWLFLGAFIHFVISERDKEERRPNNITDDGFAR